MAMLPLLSLVMIVKNESESIRETLLSCRPHIDRWTILDTGSTDGTPDIIRQTMAGMDGELHEEPFVDFATTRNRVLDLAEGKSVFTLMLSGDEYLREGQDLRAFCEARREESGGAYYVRIKFGSSLVYDSARIVRCGEPWRYKGVTHEVLVGPDPTVGPGARAELAHIHHDRGGSPEGQRRRWELDKELLGQRLVEAPGDARAMFYLAQSLECLGEHQAAFDMYQRRIDVGGWKEEVYEAMFRRARTAALVGRPWGEVQQLYLDAYAHSPTRAEPLHAIAVHWRDQANWPLAFLFAHQAYRVPFPNAARMFVDAETYAFRIPSLVGTAAYYVGEDEIGMGALRKAMAHRPGDPQLEKNLRFYEDRSKK